MNSDRTEQNADEMNFDDFVSWATSYILFGIGEGSRLRHLVSTVISQACQNKLFGGCKPKKG